MPCCREGHPADGGWQAQKCWAPKDKQAGSCFWDWLGTTVDSSQPFQMLQYHWQTWPIRVGRRATQHAMTVKWSVHYTFYCINQFFGPRTSEKEITLHNSNVSLIVFLLTCPIASICWLPYIVLLFPIVGVCNCSMCCCTLLYVPSSFATILMGKRKLVALLSLSS